jgi:hypothetical protein
MVYFFGNLAYLPSLGDMTIEGIQVDGKDGMELEAGVGFRPIPLLSINLSYKSNEMDFEVDDPFVGTGSLSVDNSGPMLGLVFTF